MVKIAWSPYYAHPLPPGHRFPMEKYNLIPEQLLYEGLIRREHLFEPTPLSEEWILTTHRSGYWQRLSQLQLSAKEMRRTGFPHSQQLITRETVIAQGTILATQFAIEHGAAMNISGGTHHAFTDRGEGFCLLNDQAIAANYLLHTNQANQILIIDLDVHQGNGTAEIFQQEPRVFTFSMHCEANYPMEKERSDLDIPLKPGTRDAFYMENLRSVLPALLDGLKPDFAFYLSGADIIETDKLGKLALSKQGAHERDQFVYQELIDRNIPVVTCMGGGYSENIRDIVDTHCNTFRAVIDLYT